MQFKIFNISSFGDNDKEEELNRFLRSHKIVSIDKELFCVENLAYWSFCVRWMQQNVGAKDITKTDYTKTLTKEEFIRFEKLKITRKIQQFNPNSF